MLPTQGFTASAWLRIEAAQQSTILALSDGGKQLSLELDGTQVIARAALGGAPVSVQGRAAVIEPMAPCRADRGGPASSRSTWTVSRSRARLSRSSSSAAH